MNEAEMMDMPGGVSHNDGFRTSLFGFRRDEVLRYIDQVLQENKAQTDYYKVQIQNLEETIAASEQEKNEIYSKAKEVATLLRTEQERNKQLLEQHEKILKEAQIWQTKLNAKENEITMLRRDKSRLESRVAELENELETARANSAQIERTIFEAEKKAASIIANAEQEAAHFNQGVLENAADISKSMSVLKQELRNTEQRIDIAFSSMKDATYEIESAMQRVDAQLNTLTQKRKEISWQEVAKEIEHEKEMKRLKEQTEAAKEAAAAKAAAAPSPTFEDVAKKVTPTLQLLQDKLIDSINKLLSSNDEKQ